MVNCCSIEGTNRYFSRSAGYYAMRFRIKGLDHPQRLLLEGLRREGFIGKSVLEIGCGVGGLHLTMLKQGAQSAIGVEASEGMIAKAMELAVEMGLEGLVRYMHGDFMDSYATLGPSSVVVMDKVVCCYPHPLALLQAATSRCTDLFALSYPRDGTFARWAFTIAAKFGETFRFAFHPFYHPPAAIRATIGKAGFVEVFSEATAVWQIGVYRRTGGERVPEIQEPILIAAP